MAKTGIKIKRCNVGSVEAHNKRTKEYLEGLKKAGKPLYYFPDLTPNNVSWENPRYEGKSCQTLFDEMKQLYIDKVGQAPQLKDREVTLKKSGKKKTVAGWSPIREGCPPIKEDTTIEDFKPVIDWARKHGLDVIRIDLHFDEGHVDPETKERILNRHAHVVFDWIDHETGLTKKLPKPKMSEIQTLLATALGMERGTPKAETGLEHIPAAEYREMKAAETAQRLEDKAKRLEEENKQLREEIDSLQKEKEKLENENKTLNKNFAEVAYLIEREQQRRDNLYHTNNALEVAQAGFSSRLGEMLKKQVETAKAQIEDTSVKMGWFGSRQDKIARQNLRTQIIDAMKEVIENPTAHLKDVMELPDEIQQAYRRVEAQSENDRRNTNYSNIDSPAIMQTNADLRKKYQQEAALLDELNMQHLSEDVKGRLLEGESVSVRKKWYDSEKSKFTDEEEATLSVSNWSLRFNGKSFREFLNQVWVKMAKAAQELKEAAQRKLDLSRQKGRGFKL